MSSLLTNASAMTALQTLNMTNKNLSVTQSRISTGLRVNDASDNAAYWSIATTMRSDNEALSAVQDALGLGASTVDTAFTAVNNAIGDMNKIKKLVTAASEGTLDKDKLQSDLTQLQQQLRTNAEAASFNGVNWVAQNSTDTVAGVDTDNPIKDVVGGFTRDTNGNVSVQKIKVDTSNAILIDSNATLVPTAPATDRNVGILTSDIMEGAGGIFALANAALTGTANVDFSNLQVRNETTGALTALTTNGTAVVAGENFSMLQLDFSNLTDSENDKAILSAIGQVLENKISAMTDAATTLGSTKSRIDSQVTFTGKLMDSISRGIGQLVDADMNAESTRLQALQTQQQLGIQALSIANQGAQNILSLFR